MYTDPGKAALTALKSMDISHGVLLNAYSMNTSGTRIAGRIKTAHPELPVVHITDGSPSSSLVAEVLLDPKPSIRILVNCFELFSPFDLEQCTWVGELVLDEENGRVKTPEGVASITPKTTALLKILMEHVGKWWRRMSVPHRVGHGVCWGYPLAACPHQDAA